MLNQTFRSLNLEMTHQTGGYKKSHYNSINGILHCC